MLSRMVEAVVLMTTTDVARRLAVAPSTVRRWVESGTLHPTLVTPGGHFRFHPADVKAILAPTDASDERSAS